MSLRTMLLRLMQFTGSKRPADLARATGLMPAEISKMRSRVHAGNIKMATLLMISTEADIPIGLLAEWWAEPDTADVREPLTVPWFKDTPVLRDAMRELWHDRMPAKPLKLTANDITVLPEGVAKPVSKDILEVDALFRKIVKPPSS